MAPPFGSRGRRRTDQQRGGPPRDRPRGDADEKNRRGGRSYRPGLHDWTPGAAGRPPAGSPRAGGELRKPAAGGAGFGERPNGSRRPSGPPRSYLRPGSMGGASAEQRASYERDSGLADDREPRQESSERSFTRRRSLVPGRPAEPFRGNRAEQRPASMDDRRPANGRNRTERDVAAGRRGPSVPDGGRGPRSAGGRRGAMGQSGLAGPAARSRAGGDGAPPRVHNAAHAETAGEGAARSRPQVGDGAPRSDAPTQPRPGRAQYPGRVRPRNTPSGGTKSADGRGARGTRPRRTQGRAGDSEP